MRTELGLDQPIPIQYARWLGAGAPRRLGAIHPYWRAGIGRPAEPPSSYAPTDGYGYGSGSVDRPAVGHRVGLVPKLQVRHGDHGSGHRGAAVPDFWLGILFIYVFALWLRVVPPSGYVPLDEGLWPNVRSMLLPALSLGMYLTAITMRQNTLLAHRSHAARVRYCSPGQGIARESCSHAARPQECFDSRGHRHRITGGAAVWWGRCRGDDLCAARLGRVAANSIFFRDFPMLQGAMLVMAVGVLAANLLTDLLYAFADPRIRYT